MSSRDYSFWSRVFHRLALGSRLVAETSFDIERLLFPVRDRNVVDEPHVFVAGLARAGTTILMRELHASGAYRSLTYRDMPFLLAPNLWDRISRSSRQHKDAFERAHGDGILVDFDSPEALEEVFWRVHCGADYILEDRLVPMSIGPETEADFIGYVSLLLRSCPDRRYLSKNNNNILRLSALTRCFPKAVVIIPFREPTQQACSLMRQHQLFLARHKDDSYSRDYMTWLVHHEFGQDHRPFVFNDRDFAALREHDPETELTYWLRLWTDTYRHILNTAPKGCLFLSYERLCDDTQSVWSWLCERLDLPRQSPPDSLQRSQHAMDVAASGDSREASDIHNALREREMQPQPGSSTANSTDGA